MSGNWKMHEDHAEALEFVQELAALLCVSGVPAGREVSIHPPFTSLPALQAAVEAGHVPVAMRWGRRHGAARAKVRWQVAAALAGRPAGTMASAVIAHEPIWAVGAGQTATPGDAGEMCSAIRDQVGQLAGPGAAAAVRIQYGGSVTPGTAAALLGAESVDGCLVGGASLDVGSSPPSCSPGPDPRGACTRAQAPPRALSPQVMDRR